MPHLTENKAVSKPEKPAKPYPDFPLFPHGNGWWAKKIRGKLYYFGKWADWQGALAKYQEQRDDLQAGRAPRTQADGVIVHELVNRFLAAKRHQVDTRELSARTWADYRTVCERVARVFGTRRLVTDIGPDDFERLRRDFAETHKSPSSLAKDITVVKVLFKWAVDSGLVDRAVRFGPDFKKPSAKIMRRAKQDAGARMFEAAELRRIIAVAGVPLKAMILLGINCGFGNHDCGMLPLSALKLKDGWLDFPRPKTAVERRCPLWPETVKAIEAALAERPTPRTADAEDKLFVTLRGLCWAKARDVKQVDVEDDDGDEKTVEKVTADNPIAKEFAKLVAKLGIRRKRIGFYGLRRTFHTIGEGARDIVAVRFVMGHAPGGSDMSAVYRERIDNDRLLAVVNHVRDWLLTNGRGENEKAPDGGWTIE